ncbi:hypothetical protein KY290_007310 [Solanum tuberosum]|uniref:Uncharacterized protein n=1 Tax=Solanum tuberosum TaxID=4113 RepID=A0ABQ7W594_SOLTU|nr:hypothetical protein KY289_007633 [Solanum tuberosum]KAH0775899.1 hypothetical protein KY290_007310 [Solanum tuberosum]
MKVSQTGTLFQKVMNNRMRREMHSILGLLSIFQDEKASFDQKIIDVLTSLPNQVMGIEKRTFKRLELMVGMTVWGTRKPWTTAEYVTIKFNIEVRLEGSQSDSSISTIHFGGRRHKYKGVMEGVSFSMCKKLVQVLSRAGQSLSQTQI